MESMNVFEIASRKKIRFAYRGSLSVEDLWDLNVQELDKIFKTLNAKLKVCQEESLLGKRGSVSTEVDTQIAIIRRIVEVKLAEAMEREMEDAKKAKRAKILTILAEKQDGALASKSEEDLNKILAVLKAATY